MNKLIFFLSLFYISGSVSYSSEQTINHKLKNNQNKYVVISTNGVNVRNKPNTNSKILFSLSYGTKVNIIERSQLKRDTIGGHKFYNSNEEEYLSPVSGYWVKIEYKNQTGYIFDAYLYKDWNSKSMKPKLDLNEDYVLLFPGSWCNYNFWYKDKLFWYGVYAKNNTKIIKPVRISFYKDYEGDLTDVGISTSDNKNLLFIIGSKYQINKGEINGKHSNSWWSNHFDEYPELHLKNDKNNGTSLTIKLEGKKQILNPKNDNYHLHPSGIIWKGDLDGDLKADYIIHYGEKEGQTLLYLSSEAEYNQVIKPVAIFYSGYCC